MLPDRIATMVDQFTALERVATTPIPISCMWYCVWMLQDCLPCLPDGIHLKQCVTVYLFSLPFTLVHDMQYVTQFLHITNTAYSRFKAGKWCLWSQLLLSP